MADFIDINVKNPSTGSTELNNSLSNETENKIQNLLNKIEKPSGEEISLSALNSVVGLPVESDIELEKLIEPPKEWTDIFTKASELDIQKMAASIYQYGLLHRITVWQQDNEKFIILGGMTRTAAFRYLYKFTLDKKWSSIPAKIYSENQLDEIDAKRIFIVSNTDQRQMSTKNISFAYYNLIKLEKERAFYGSGIYSRDAAAKQANVSPTTFNNYLKLVDLYPPLLEEIDKENFQITAAYEISFLNQELQKYIYDKKYYLTLKRKIARIIKEHAVTVEDIDGIINEQNTSAEKFKYSVMISNKLPEDCEIFPLIVSKEHKQDILKILKKSIKKSTLPNEIKKILLTDVK